MEPQSPSSNPVEDPEVDEILKKQLFLKKEIIESGYDKHEFAEFMAGMRGKYSHIQKTALTLQSGPSMHSRSLSKISSQTILNMMRTDRKVKAQIQKWSNHLKYRC